jgi:uncharacterized protein (DUF1015 family)
VESVATRPPLLSTTTEDGFCHRLWAVTDRDELAAVDADLSGREALIADGHHRWATYERLREEHPGEPAWAYGLVLLVDSVRYPLQVQAIHRLLPGLPLGDALDRLDGTFRVRPLDLPLPGALAALDRTPGTAFVLSAGPDRCVLLDRPEPGLVARAVRADRPEAWRTLDATVLHEALLDTVWRIPDDPGHIRYLHSARAAVEQAAKLGGTAVLLRPVREETVRELAEQGVTMPRKSTSFGPKPATGLVLRALRDG